MAEVLFSQSTPHGNDCLRSDYPLDVDVPHAPASLYLTAIAADQARDYDLLETVSEEERQAAVRFAHDQTRATSIGAAIVCARTIGRGDCPVYAYDVVQEAIVKK
jgi:hypothetical protein